MLLPSLSNPFLAGRFATCVAQCYISLSPTTLVKTQTRLKSKLENISLRVPLSLRVDRAPGHTCIPNLSTPINDRRLDHSIPVAPWAPAAIANHTQPVRVKRAHHIHQGHSDYTSIWRLAEAVVRKPHLAQYVWWAFALAMLILCWNPQTEP